MSYLGKFHLKVRDLFELVLSYLPDDERTNLKNTQSVEELFSVLDSIQAKRIDFKDRVRDFKLDVKTCRRLIEDIIGGYLVSKLTKEEKESFFILMGIELRPKWISWAVNSGDEERIIVKRLQTVYEELFWIDQLAYEQRLVRLKSRLYEFYNANNTVLTAQEVDALLKAVSDGEPDVL